MQQLEVGAVFEGKVTGITRFGAFVALPMGGNGLVHISEIARGYVNDVHDCLTEGQMVKVKVIGLGEGGKVNLSIMRAEEPAPGEQQQQQRPRGGNRGNYRAPTPPAELSFEDKLKHFMQDSDSRMSGNKLYAEKRTSRRRRDY